MFDIVAVVPHGSMNSDKFGECRHNPTIGGFGTLHLAVVSVLVDAPLRRHKALGDVLPFYLCLLFDQLV